MSLISAIIGASFFFVNTVLAQSNSSTIDYNNCCSNAQEATAFALTYGTPLVAYANSTTYLGALGGPNKLLSAQTLQNPEGKSVVRPNVDTLYTLSYIDLSQSDLVFTVPVINDGRYWVFPFLDPYGDEYAQISSVNGFPAGQYLLRRADDAQVPSGLQLTPDSANCFSKYQGIINSPTTYGTLVGRILVKSNTTADLDIVHGYQRGIHITTTPRTLTNPYLPQAPVLTPALLDTSNITNPAQKALELTARIGIYNQPQIIADRYRIGVILGQAGISNGVYTQPAGVDLDTATSVALSSSNSIVRDPSLINVETNGWVLQNLNTQGNFMTDYASRYYIALNGYLQLVATEALYPTWAPAEITPTSLTSKQAYLFTFSGVPPVDASKGGFWSLTVYGGDQFLVPNPLGKNEVGDRSNLTYADGSLVYPQTSSTNTSSSSIANKPFQVLLQPENVTPPSNWTSNWLPAPADGGEVIFLLRWYAPTAAFENKGYEYPLVQKIDAITA